MCIRDRRGRLRALKQALALRFNMELKAVVDDIVQIPVYSGIDLERVQDVAWVDRWLMEQTSKYVVSVLPPQPSEQHKRRLARRMRRAVEAAYQNKRTVLSLTSPMFAPGLANEWGEKGNKCLLSWMELKKSLTKLRLGEGGTCLLYTSPSPRDQRGSRMPSSA